MTHGMECVMGVRSEGALGPGLKTLEISKETMRLICKLLAIVFVLVLGACDRIKGVAMSAAEKVNLAVPIAPEITTAQSVFYAALKANKTQEIHLVEQFEQLMTVRALSCMGTTRVGRFEEPSDIRSKFTDLECFKKQDTVLADWLGLQRVALALRLPALRPYAELKGKVTIASDQNSVTMAAATSANIVVVKSNTGKFTTLDLSGGKPISSFQAPGEAHRFASVSPNGRMLAVPVSNRSLTLFDLESGTVLWTTEKYSDVVAWMPGIEAVVLNETGAGRAVLMDLRTGKSEPYLPAERNLSWALAMPGNAGQFLIGNQNSAALMDQGRGSDGTISSVTSKQWRLAGSGASSPPPMLMRDGAMLAFVSNRDLGWLNLETGTQGVWEMTALRGYGFAKFDETHIIFTDSKRTANANANPRKLLDVEHLMVSTALDVSATEGYALPFSPRAGYAKSLNSALVIQTTAQADNPQPLAELIAQAQLEEQLAKLQVQAEPAAPFSPTAYTPAEMAVADAVAAATAAAVAASEARPRAERPNYIDLLSQQVRAANVASGMRDGLPRDVIERIRNGSSQKIPQTTGAQLTAPVPKPLLVDVPANAQIAMVGVYQGTRSGPPAPGGGSRAAGVVKVTIGPGSTPLVLVLSSYEPVRWNVQNTAGRKIAAVLLSGYHESEAAGLAGTQVLKIGSGHAYKLDSPEYKQLKSEVARYVSSPVVSFQGRYEGQEFAVTQ